MAKSIPVVIGLNYGDEGKGTTVDFLCYERPIDYVVRFSGGPQTAHNVVTSDGKDHTFALFGSGTFQKSGTILTRFVLVNPFNMIVEANDIFEQSGINPFEKTIISENCLLITPIHVQANRQREINRGANPHGSCGEGIGETRAYALYQTPDDPITVKDLNDMDALQRKLETLQQHLEDEIDSFVFDRTVPELLDDYQEMLNDHNFNIWSDSAIQGLIYETQDNLVFEGSQGILLDESFGFHPHTTWSSVTSANAIRILEESGVDSSRAEVIGITRTYTTRHGHGPFPSEFPENYQTWEEDYPERHNAWGRFQGSWRAGVLDISLINYALKVDPRIDSLCLTHCDIPIQKAVTGWEEEILPVGSEDLVYQETLTNKLNGFQNPVTHEVSDVHELIRLLEKETNTPVAILSYGPKAEDKSRI